MYALGELLRQHLKGKNTRLHLFVAASSYPRMLNRIQHPIFSQPYYDALMNINIHRLTFFDFYSLKPSNSDETFMAAIPMVINCCRLQIPNLKAAADAQNLQGLYTVQTYIEYQEVLSALITHFKSALVVLNAKPDPWVEGYEGHVEAVATYGSLLQLMVGGRAIEVHLQNIASQHQSVPSQTAASHDNGEDLDDDVELRRVKPHWAGEPLSKWESCRDWLKLMIAPFEALDIILHHLDTLPDASGTMPTISIRIIAVQHQGHEMLPWETLLNNKAYFPDEKGLPGNNMEHIISSIKKYGVSSLPSSEDRCEVRDIIAALKSLQNCVDQASVVAATDDIIADLQSLAGQLASFGSEQAFEDALRRVAVLKTQFQQDTFCKNIDKAIVLIESMNSVCKFLRELLQPGSPLVTGDGFAGTLHCELLLAILMAMSQYPSSDHKISTEILNMLSVSCNLLLTHIFLMDNVQHTQHIIGVSKPCCPVCSSVLSLLSGHDDHDDFLARGMHNTITACTLPMWTPPELRNKIIKINADALKQELITLVQREHVQRLRRGSVGSVGSQGFDLDPHRDTATPKSTDTSVFSILWAKVWSSKSSFRSSFG